MNTSTRSAGRTLWVAVRATALLTVVCGVVYTLAVTGVGHLVAPRQADGSLVSTASGEVVGSSLLGQGFLDAHGNPLPQYFQPRPSATGWDAANSSGSNDGPENKELVAAIARRRDLIARFDGVPESAVPPDAVTASASGLDPDISPAYARIQIARVARARKLPVAAVRSLVAAHTSGRELGYLGEPTVDVLQLNLALDELRR